MLKIVLVALFLVTPTAQAEESQNIPSAWTMVLPFGGPQFATDRNKLGFVFGGLQLAGAGSAIYSGLEMVRLAESGEPEDVDQELRFRTLSAVSVGIAAAAWLASVMDGSHARDVAVERAQSARAWESSQPQRGVLEPKALWVP